MVTYAVTLYDGICDLSKELVKLTRTMTHDDKWVVSSSGSHMFIHYAVQTEVSRPGFLAQIHYGNDINNLRIM